MNHRFCFQPELQECNRAARIVTENEARLVTICFESPPFLIFTVGTPFALHAGLLVAPVSEKSRAGRPLVGPRTRGRDNGATAREIAHTVHQIQPYQF